MITVNEALQLIQSHMPVGPTSDILVGNALHRVAAQDILCPLDSPHFAQAAMDGYVIDFSHTELTQAIPIQHTIQAGDTKIPTLEKGKAIRIFTGAAIPVGADTLIIQEKVKRINDAIYIEDHHLVKAGDHIRQIGSQIQKGDNISLHNKTITPAIMAYLAGLGISTIRVFNWPIIRIIVTGNELLAAGEFPIEGKVYESNGLMLQSLLAQMHIPTTHYMQVADEQALITAAINSALLEADIVLISGGVSVGDFDYVPDAIRQTGGDIIFHKVKQKPGKPFCFARHQEKAIFALPGNPSSVLTCFYMYVLPAIRKWIGKSFALPFSTQPLLHDYSKKGSLVNFVKSTSLREGVAICGAQESYKLNAFIDANALVKFSEEEKEYRCGDIVDVYDLHEIIR